ncbi:MAG: hypothetical protein Q9159_004329 [Coniocarpon cinnabarinum]
MAQRPPPAPEPILTPQFCVNATALQDFLRLSRSTVDDSISTHLNAMLTPSRPSLFSSTPTQPEPPPRGNRRNISGETCARFKDEVLFPNWRSRDDVLSYCSNVAVSPDAAVASTEQEASGAEHRDFWGNVQPTDERLDPYSARDYSYNRESNTQQLRSVLANEQGVERIVRSRSWGILGERCVGEKEKQVGAGISGQGEDDWRGEYQRWRSREG